MKMYRCKTVGMVDPEGCYTCFMKRRNEREYSSRVICKTENIIEVVDVEEEITSLVKK